MYTHTLPHPHTCAQTHPLSQTHTHIHRHALTHTRAQTHQHSNTNIHSLPNSTFISPTTLTSLQDVKAKKRKSKKFQRTFFRLLVKPEAIVRNGAIFFFDFEQRTTSRKTLTRVWTEISGSHLFTPFNFDSTFFGQLPLSLSHSLKLSLILSPSPPLSQSLSSRLYSLIL